MKYKVGDRVKIKSLDWYNENKSKSHGTIACGGKYFDYDMREWCGKIMTILEAYQTCYIMKEDGAKDLWTDDMIEGLVEEKSANYSKVIDNGVSNPIIAKTSSATIDTDKGFYSYSSDGNLEMEWNLPQGYQFVDENGNVINAMKIVLVKKKKEYPKTYEECCTVLRFHYDHYLTYDDEKDINPTKEEEEFINLMDTFSRLIVCRNAYWKIYGEETGLGKPWEPDWTDFDQLKHCIWVDAKEFVTITNVRGQHILAFPTAEMRDAFYENFKDLIESVKELL